MAYSIHSFLGLERTSARGRGVEQNADKGIGGAEEGHFMRASFVYDHVCQFCNNRGLEVVAYSDVGEAVLPQCTQREQCLGTHS